MINLECLKFLENDEKESENLRVISNLFGMIFAQKIVEIALFMYENISENKEEITKECK